MWEVAVWEDALTTDGRDVYLVFQVHNEAIVIPETIDCIRALTGLEAEAAITSCFGGADYRAPSE